MSQTAYKQWMLAWEWPTNYVIYIYIYGHDFLLKIRLCQVLALQLLQSSYNGVHIIAIPDIVSVWVSALNDEF